MAVEVPDENRARGTRIDVLENRHTRRLLYALFAVLALLTDIITIVVCFSSYSQVPKYLSVLNVLWTIAALVIGLAALFVLCRPDVVARRVSESAMDIMSASHYRKNRVIFASLILPFNGLWFYQYAGTPALVEGQCAYYQEFDGVLMKSAPGETYPPATWILAGSSTILAQPSCESVINTALDGILGLSGDRWDELYLFGLRLFGFCAGALADSQVMGTGDSFMADLLDIFDLYVMSFENVNLMQEGKRALWVGQYNFIGASFDFVVCLVIILAYILAFLRASRSLGLGGRCLPRPGPADRLRIVDLFLSASQEIAFLLIRLFAWFVYEIPVSVLLIKNSVALFVVLQDFWHDVKAGVTTATTEVRGAW